ncbi:MAG: Hsp70 family protein, partial [Deferribacterales bacterium]|nr:Hsp70 family protein [Deferribacterales bacterium]
MVKDAELNAEADRKKKELIEVKNQADTLIYSTEKSLKEHGDKVDAATKESIEKALEELKQLQAGDDAEKIKAGIEKLANASHKLAEEIYKTAGAQQGQNTGSGAEAGAGAEQSDNKDENVVDADFEEVKDDK